MIVTGAGLVTMVLGAVIALFKHDFEGVAGLLDRQPPWPDHHALGTGTAFGAMAAVFHILNHATFKAALFMSAGHRRPRSAHTRHSPPWRASNTDACHVRHRHHRGAVDGGDPAAQRLSLERDDAGGSQPHHTFRQHMAGSGAGHAWVDLFRRPIAFALSGTPSLPGARRLPFEAARSQPGHVGAAAILVVLVVVIGVAPFLVQDFVFLVAKSVIGGVAELETKYIKIGTD